MFGFLRTKPNVTPFYDNSNDMVSIQVLDHNNWRTVHMSHSNPGVVFNNMQVASTPEHYRVRAVNSSGNIVDML